MIRFMRNRKRQALVCFTSMLLLAGCFQPPASSKPKYALEQLDSRVVQADRRFGLQLYGELTKRQEAGSNLFISPISITMALALAYNGTHGSTRAAMSQALQWNELQPEEVNRGHEVLLDLLNHNDSGSVLSIANAMWVHEGLALNPQFIRQAKTHYLSEVKALDFTKERAHQTINQWVKKQTHGKIPAMVEPPLNPQALLMLMNAVYFKGNWDRPFRAEATEQRDFHLTGGKTRPVPMMSQSGSFEYMRTGQYQAVRIPYTGKRQSMLVILPDEALTLESLQASLLSHPETWSSSFPVQPGTPRLPRFQLNVSLQLNQALTALGMAEAFAPGQADFSGITAAADKLSVDEVLHKSFIEVNEKGTEAAAATSVQMAGSAPAPAAAPFEMTVDRPFFFAIEDRSTGALLFLGSVFSPEQ